MNCYAETVAARFSGPGQPYEGLAKWVERPDGKKEARWTGEVKFVENHLLDPIRKQRPRLYFVNSTSDIFFEPLKDSEIDQIVAVMGLAGLHTFQVLTKRHERMAEYLTNPKMIGRVMDAALKLMPSDLWNGNYVQLENEFDEHGRLPNVWWGVSCEDQKSANERVPAILKIPAAVRWVSYEPAIGPIDFCKIDCNGAYIDALAGYLRNDINLGLVACKALDWIVIGGESHPSPARAKPFEMRWAEDLIGAAEHSGTAVYVKQMGCRPMLAIDGAPGSGGFAESEPYNISGKGDDPAEWPTHLRVQEYPKGYERPKTA